MKRYKEKLFINISFNNGIVYMIFDFLSRVPSLLSIESIIAILDPRVIGSEFSLLALFLKKIFNF